MLQKNVNASRIFVQTRELPIILLILKDLFRTAIHKFWSAIYLLMQVKIKLSTTFFSGFMEVE